MLDLNKDLRTIEGHKKIVPLDLNDYAGIPSRLLFAVNNGSGGGVVNAGGDLWSFVSFDREKIHGFMENVPVKHKLTGFLNVDDKADIYFTSQKWNDRDFADSFQMGKRIACIPIELEYKEGDGIEKPGD